MHLELERVAKEAREAMDEDGIEQPVGARRIVHHALELGAGALHRRLKK